MRRCGAYRPTEARPPTGLPQLHAESPVLWAFADFFGSWSPPGRLRPAASLEPYRTVSGPCRVRASGSTRHAAPHVADPALCQRQRQAQRPRGRLRPSRWAWRPRRPRWPRQRRQRWAACAPHAPPFSQNREDGGHEDRPPERGRYRTGATTPRSPARWPRAATPIPTSRVPKTRPPRPRLAVVRPH